MWTTEARGALHTYRLPVADVSIGNRSAFARTLIDGRAVTEFEPNGRAAGEPDAASPRAGKGRARYPR